MQFLKRSAASRLLLASAALLCALSALALPAAAQTNIFSESLFLTPGYLQKPDGTLDTTISNGTGFDVLNIRILPGSVFTLHLNLPPGGDAYMFGNAGYPAIEYFADNGGGAPGAYLSTYTVNSAIADGASWTAPPSSSGVAWMRVQVGWNSSQTYQVDFASTQINTSTPYVPPPSPTITFTVANHYLGDAPFIVAATSNSGGPLSYGVVSGPATASGSLGNQITLTGLGTVVLLASQAAGTGYAAATQQASFTVTAPAPTLVLAAIPNHANTDPPFTVSANSNSSGAITYSIVSGPATISGSTVSLTGGGGAVIVRASQAASGSYGPATATQSFTVTAPLTGGAFSAITWVNITDGQGHPLPSGIVCAAPVTNSLVPISPNWAYGGVTGTIKKTPTCGNVSGGVLQSGFQLIRSNLTTPGPLCYLFTLQNTIDRSMIIGPGDGLDCVQPTTSTLEISTVPPNLPGLVMQTVGAAGAPGPQGPAGTPGTALFTGKRCGFTGDSITNYNSWEATFLALTGCTEVFRDARPGRRRDQAFEVYGNNPYTGTNGGAVAVSSSLPGGGGTVTNVGTCGSGTNCGGTAGHTLAQDLANIDYLIDGYGTNDVLQVTPLGTYGAAPAMTFPEAGTTPVTTGTLYGYAAGFLRAVYTANPNIKVIQWGPYLVTNYYSAVTLNPVETALSNVAQDWGTPFFDGRKFGINDVNGNGSNIYLLSDKLHPSTLGGTTLIGPRLARFAQLFAIQ